MSWVDGAVAGDGEVEANTRTYDVRWWQFLGPWRRRGEAGNWCSHDAQF